MIDELIKYIKILEERLDNPNYSKFVRKHYKDSLNEINELIERDKDTPYMRYIQYLRQL